MLWLFDDERTPGHHHRPAQDEEENRRVCGAFVQRLDDRSLGLIIRDAKNDRKKTTEILREYYLGKSMPRIRHRRCPKMRLGPDFMGKAETEQLRSRQRVR